MVKGWSVYGGCVAVGVGKAGVAVGCGVEVRVAVGCGVSVEIDGVTVVCDVKSVVGTDEGRILTTVKGIRDAEWLIHPMRHITITPRIHRVAETLFLMFLFLDDERANGPRIRRAAGLPAPLRATRRLSQGLLSQLSTWLPIAIAAIAAQPRRLHALVRRKPDDPPNSPTYSNLRR